LWLLAAVAAVVQVLVAVVDLELDQTQP